MQTIESTPKKDRILNTKAVLSEKFDDLIHHATLRRMWQKGDIPPPFTIGGQNCWYESTLDKTLGDKHAEALRQQADIQAKLSRTP
jgi:hypothetical protein